LKSDIHFTHLVKIVTPRIRVSIHIKINHILKAAIEGGGQKKKVPIRHIA
jgi:hypothetical protein